ncbi:hypothetical protein PVAND_014953 [Polypedilum vanderplanki]|uniref:DM domain-containing protein n=1 Tax=Polypedilum vanderplanki TaxID=319348 RepID=A0A9J6BAU4_POLVA|nr:hypothetical protein PVAND_014953 [Polypedilum vanderplanki]
MPNIKPRFCYRCQQHGLRNPIKKHKDNCQFKTCNCFKCEIQKQANALVVAERKGREKKNEEKQKQSSDEKNEEKNQNNFTEEMSMVYFEVESDLQYFDY